MLEDTGTGGTVFSGGGGGGLGGAADDALISFKSNTSASAGSTGFGLLTFGSTKDGESNSPSCGFLTSSGCAYSGTDCASFFLHLSSPAPCVLGCIIFGSPRAPRPGWGESSSPPDPVGRNASPRAGSGAGPGSSSGSGSSPASSTGTSVGFGSRSGFRPASGFGSCSSSGTSAGTGPRTGPGPGPDPFSEAGFGTDCTVARVEGGGGGSCIGSSDP
mmetsp:Transcript_32371/g.78762  ORF Transcript_32371/g.78762 Transcript_32371/m.78762 type:complete len:217 (-) Transcript_32371:216-866(-)